jgi:hypothetical protein
MQTAQHLFCSVSIHTYDPQKLFVRKEPGGKNAGGGGGGGDFCHVLKMRGVNNVGHTEVNYKY